jgi:hypothetical protein
MPIIFHVQFLSPLCWYIFYRTFSFTKIWTTEGPNQTNMKISLSWQVPEVTKHLWLEHPIIDCMFVFCLEFWVCIYQFNILKRMQFSFFKAWSDITLGCSCHLARYFWDHYFLHLRLRRVEGHGRPKAPLLTPTKIPTMQNSTGATSQQRAKIISHLHLLLFIFKWIFL